MTSLTRDVSPASPPRATVLAVAAGILVYPATIWLFQRAGQMAAGPQAIHSQWSTMIPVVLAGAVPFALPALGYWLARKNSTRPLTEEALFNRRVAHLAFATPSLFVAEGSYSGLFDLRPETTVLWFVIWLAIAAMLLLHVPKPRQVEAAIAGVPSWLRTAHGSTAALLLLFYLVGHIANHASALFGLGVQHAMMDTLRLWYRSSLVQPILITGFLFMIVSGLILARARTRTATDRLGTLQTLTGGYLAAFLFSHLSSTFIARVDGVNTDWSWATATPPGLLAGAVSLIPHYMMGVAFLITHLGLGLRTVLLQHRIERAIADRLAWTIAGSGALLSTAIMAGMLGLHA